MSDLSRASIIKRMKRQIVAIDALLIDADHWNRAHPTEAPINADPDGSLRHIRAAYARIVDPNIITEPYVPYVPSIGVRAPWLTEADGLNVNELFNRARSTHEDERNVARGEIRSVQANYAQWTAPDAFNPDGKDPTPQANNFYPGTSLADIKRVVAFQL